jgi:folylpolyglutamate synthase/dihydropteroate synthase
MRARFVLLGTNHPLQFGAPNVAKEKVCTYREYLTVVCHSEGIKLIAEEASHDVLESFSVKETVGAKVARETAVGYRMVDLSFDERFPLGISDGQLSSATFMLKNRNQFNLQPLRDRLNKISDQVRECTWVARTLAEATFPALLIVGANHVRGVEKLIRSLRQEVVVAHADYEP